MKLKSVSTLVKSAQKTAGQLRKLYKELDSCQRHLAYTIERYEGLPAAIAEATAELKTLCGESAMACAELTKDIDSYTYAGNYRHGRDNAPRKYSSPVAQKAWDAQVRERRQRERLEGLEADQAMTIEAFTSDARASLEAIQSQVSISQAILDNTLKNISTIMGRDYTLDELATIPQTKKTKEAPQEWIIPAVKVGEVYRVQADNFCKIAGELFNLDGVRFWAKQISEWAKLEKGNILEIRLDYQTLILFIKSPTSRAQFKHAGDWQSAPALVFATA